MNSSGELATPAWGTEVPPARTERVTFAQLVGSNKRDSDKDEFEAETESMRSWAESAGNFWGIGKTHTVIPSGVYSPQSSATIGAFLQKMENRTDNLLHFPDSASEEVLNEIEHFQTLKGAFRDFGFLHKRGILLHGPPGSGKTSTIQLLIDKLVNKQGGIAVFVDNPLLAAEAFRLVRGIEPDRQILAVMEDFDALVERYGASAFLSLLDGEAQVDNVVMLATTNYPSRLEKRFVDRPSRFDLIKEIGMPSAEARRVYLMAKGQNMPAADLEEFIEKTEDYSIAHLREVIILNRVFGLTPAQTLERMERFRAKLADGDRGKMGGFSFGSNLKGKR